MSITLAWLMARAGRRDEAVDAAVLFYLKTNHTWYQRHRNCPWHTGIRLRQFSLFTGQPIVDSAVHAVLGGISREIDEAGGERLDCPSGFTHTAAVIDLPASRVIVGKQVPMLLRQQLPDGSWGENTRATLTALKACGLLEPLSQLPPLPRDWVVGESVPAPLDSTDWMIWGDGKLWAATRYGREAVGVSPDDGQVVARVAIPFDTIDGIGWWRNSIVVTQKNPKRLVCLDPATGEQVGERALPFEWVDGACGADGKLMLGDIWDMSVFEVDSLTQPGWGTHHWTARHIPAHFASQGKDWEGCGLSVGVNDLDSEGSRSQIWWKPDWRTAKTYPGSGSFVRI